MGIPGLTETARAPNDWNKYGQEPQRTDKKRLLTDTSTTGEPVKAFIDWHDHENPVRQITSRGIQGGKHKKDTGCLRWPIQERKITGIKGSGIFDLEENKVDAIEKNLPPWVEVEETLEEAEAPKGTEDKE